MGVHSLWILCCSFLESYDEETLNEPLVLPDKSEHKTCSDRVGLPQKRY